MNARRPPSAPPSIAGFEFLKLLGSGGFADVFLYQQAHPRRQVAVKVLLKEQTSTAAAAGFTEEANLMAQLASHPYIVSVYEAGVSTDGRPYLVMENCSRPNLQARHRRERFSEAETLRVGIQIASAIEAAHRFGILHRDIKPANILVTEYGRPALTDFGISATTGSQMTGMSIPWSPPEAFLSPPQGDATSDVYSLAATLYTLLTNRSPFEIPGSSNTQLDVMSRIQTIPVPPIGRGDVSTSLESVLRKAMAKAPGERYSTALEFARALQRVQIELGMQPTTIDIAEDEFIAPERDDDEERTRFRGVTTIDAQSLDSPSPDDTVARTTAAATSTAPSEAVATSSIDKTVLRGPAAPPEVGLVNPAPVADTLLRSPQPALPATAPQPSEQAAPTPTPKRSKRGVILAALGSIVLLVVAVVVAISVMTNPEGIDRADNTNAPLQPVDPIGIATVPQVAELVGESAEGTTTFTWQNPNPLDGDTYLWRPVVPGEVVQFAETTETTVAFATDPAGRTCIEVVLKRANGSSAAEGKEACAP